jgi:hypothetical protein
MPSFAAGFPTVSFGVSRRALTPHSASFPAQGMA